MRRDACLFAVGLGLVLRGCAAERENADRGETIEAVR
jgi:hypothetical protein